MKASLQFRLSQHLAMTPQLQQSIRLLQLSTLELNQEIEQALADNPLLEREDDPLATRLRVAADGSIRADAPASAPGSEGPAAEAQAEPESAASDAPSDAQDSLLDWGGGAGTRDGARDGAEREGDDGPASWAAARPTLNEHLRWQLNVTQALPRDRALVEMLIEALDDNGYLTSSLEELHALLSADEGIEIDELSTALKLLQSFDPPGVGARNAAECLCIQINALARAEDSDLDPALAKLAHCIVSEHLPLLAARDFNKLRRLLDLSDDQLRAAHQLIRGLNPRPGVGFSGTGTEFVVPDVTVRRRGSRWIAELNTELMPRLRVNADFAAAVRREARAQGRRKPAANGAATAAAEHKRTDNAADDAAAVPSSWSQRVQEARWLIRNIQQRFDTIARVAQAIVERQQNFFHHGAIAMRPLVLREIAEAVSLHESTISRVTTGKYMATPFGVFEFKYFFGSHVATESGGAASSTAIRALIKQLIGEENPQEPLSDSQIADLLGKQGIVCARRTVAKYRELLQISPVAQRRVL
jgi:RNA polymerase sigma-54 factor